VNERHRLRIVNLSFGATTLAASVLIGWQASYLRPSPFDPLGPGAFPKLVSLLLGALSVVLIVRVLLGYGVGASDTSLIAGLDDEEETHRKRPLLAVGLFLAVIAYTAVLTLTSIGFLWPTIAFIAVTGFAMSERRPRNVVVAVGIAVAVGLALYVLFTRVLVVGLP
jgi:hypothetical protein